MKKTMPRKPTKKSPAKRMKPHKPWTKSPSATIYAAFTADRLYHVSTERTWAEQESRDCPSPAKVFAYSLVSPTRDEGRIEKVRKLCKSYIAYAKSICMEEYQQGYKSALVEVLDILNSTPTAKGGRT